jgi:multicomponent Na+:H+ antiporter subunit D
VLRVAGGVFYGLGDPPGEDPEMAEEASEESSETDEAKQRTPLTMVIPPAVLLAVALGTGILGVLGKLGPVVQAMAVRFEDQAAYNAAVLTGAHAAHPVAVYPTEPAGVTLTDLLVGLGSVAAALVLAWISLYWRRLPGLRGYRPSTRLAAAARRFQSGVVNDYVTWIVLGLACLGGVLALVAG